MVMQWGHIQLCEGEDWRSPQVKVTFIDSTPPPWTCWSCWSHSSPGPADPALLLDPIHPSPPQPHYIHSPNVPIPVPPSRNITTLSSTLPLSHIHPAPEDSTEFPCTFLILQVSQCALQYICDTLHWQRNSCASIHDECTRTEFDF